MEWDLNANFSLYIKEAINVILELHVSKIVQEYVERPLISYSDQNDSFSYVLNISLNIKIRGKLTSHLL